MANTEARMDQRSQSPHARGAILSMGDELTLGQKLDTNGQWLAQQLVDRGIVPVEHVTVPDDLDATVATLRRLASVVDVIISTGGLGPTADDLVREALARASDDVLVEDVESVRQIEGYFRGRGRSMSPLNRVQALRPSRGTSLRNGHGTAPGLFAKIRACDVFCMPGPPREMMPMFAASVVPMLRPVAGRAVLTRALHCFGIGESDLATRLGPLMERGRNPLVGTTASGGVVSIRIRYEGESDAAVANAATEEAERAARVAGAPFLFGAGEDSLPSVVLDALKADGKALAVVESCTGGLVGEMLTEIAGSSAAFVGGWITYSNELKKSLVGVPAELLESVGAVSAEVASAMAIGGVHRSGAGYAIAITGIAGPDGGSAAKPVGTVWIALAERSVGGVNDEPLIADVRQFRMGNDRRSVREWSARAALMMLWMRLRGVKAPMLREFVAGS